MDRKRIGKTDIIFIGILFGAALVLLVWLRAFYQSNGAYAEVTVDGEVYGTYRLFEDQTVEIKQDGRVTNTLVIEDGRADMTDADCPDLLCVHQRAISKENETIVCLPNRVVVKIVGTKEKSGVDAVAGG